jgi:fatty aldehyde-generating acyl-ACP reductase
MPVDFALVGHQESWRAASDVLAILRGPDRSPIPDDEVPEILPWIPPRAVCRIEARSVLDAKAHGLYIDSFIPPDRLDSSFLRENLGRVREAAAYATRVGAKIVSLGGFSSILIEGNLDRLSDHLPQHAGTVFTTGNSLTVAFIVQGIERMCLLEGRDLRSATLLIVGATGDVGSGAARCLAPRVKRVLLHARNPERLHALKAELSLVGATVDVAADLRNPPARADLVICAASLTSPSLLLDGMAPGSIVCDAGYPKNLSPGSSGARVFWGGLGQVTAGMTFEPDIQSVLYRQSVPDLLHGCLLEGIALALEGRFEPFSQGRGRIMPQRVQEIEAVAARHGIHLAPLHNGDGPLEPAVCLSETSAG